MIPYGFNDRLTMFPEFILSRMLAKNGWRVLGIARMEKGEMPNSTVSGVHVHKYRSFLSGVLRVVVLMITERPDAVHVHMLRNNRVGVVAAMLAKIFGIPVAFTEAGLLHDHYLVEDRDDPLGKPIAYERVPKRFAFKAWRSYFFHWPLMHADAVVFYSKHNIPIAQELGIKNARYIPLVADEQRWETTEVPSGIVGRLPQESYGLFVGQMKPRKGWDILLRAIPHVSREVLPKFVFVSSSSLIETDEFAHLVDSLDIRDRVVFLGRVPSNTDLKSVFEKSSLIIVPSRYEGYGLVPLEAFEMNKPVIASRVDALTDFLTHGENAYLVRPEDPHALAGGIEDVMRDPDLCQRLQNGGKATLATMRGAERSAEWLSFYQNLIKE